MAVLRNSSRIFRLGSSHPRDVAFFRIGFGIGLLVLTAVLSAAGLGQPWAWVTGVFALIHFALAYRLLRLANHPAARHT